MSFRVIQRLLNPTSELVLKENIPTYEEAQLFIIPLRTKYAQTMKDYFTSTKKEKQPAAKQPAAKLPRPTYWYVQFCTNYGRPFMHCTDVNEND